MSKQKDAILEVIQSTCDHMNADEIYMECKRKNYQVSIAGVYRNLSALVKDGVIRKIAMPNGSDLYDGCLHPHEHLMCENCKKVVDLPHVDLKQYIKEQLSLDVVSYELCLHYVCDDCRLKNK